MGASGIDLDDRIRTRMLDHVFGRPDRPLDAVLFDAEGGVLGTYHGRPGGGIAPGDGDPAVLGGRGRYAYVIDPARGWEAVYERRDGVLAQLSSGPAARLAPPAGARRGPAQRRRLPATATALAGAALVAIVAACAALAVQRGPDRAVAASVPAAATATATPTPTPTTFAAAATTARRHTVHRGETLSGIAYDAYGTTHAVPGLAAANGIADPDVIRTGTRVSLPPATTVAGAGR